MKDPPKKPITALPKTDIRYNGGTRCDMRIGPCACGAWHYHTELYLNNQWIEPKMVDNIEEAIIKIYDGKMATQFYVEGTQFCIYKDPKSSGICSVNILRVTLEGQDIIGTLDLANPKFFEKAQRIISNNI